MKTNWCQLIFDLGKQLKGERPITLIRLLNYRQPFITAPYPRPPGVAVRLRIHQRFHRLRLSLRIISKFCIEKKTVSKTETYSPTLRILLRTFLGWRDRFKDIRFWISATGYFLRTFDMTPWQRYCTIRSPSSPSPRGTYSRYTWTKRNAGFAIQK